MLVSATKVVRIHHASALTRPVTSLRHVLQLVSFDIDLTIFNFVPPLLFPLSKIGDRTPCRN